MCSFHHQTTKLTTFTPTHWKSKFAAIKTTIRYETVKHRTDLSIHLSTYLHLSDSSTYLNMQFNPQWIQHDNQVHNLVHNLLCVLLANPRGTYVCFDFSFCTAIFQPFVPIMCVPFMCVPFITRQPSSQPSCQPSRVPTSQPSRQPSGTKQTNHST